MTDAWQEQTRKVLGLLVGLRKELKVSKTELCRRSELSWETVTGLESGARDPLLSTLQRYARALGVELRIEVREPDDEPEPEANTA